jgi:hypothetical protein
LGRLVVSCAVDVLVPIYLDSGGEQVSLSLLHSIVVFVISKIVNGYVLIDYLTSIVLERGLWI